MRLLSIIILFFVFSGTTHAGEKWDYQLSEKTVFENEIDSNYCERLTVRNQFAGWVTRLSEVGPSLVFRLCFKEDPLYEDADSPGAIKGGVRTGWYEIKKGHPVKPQKLIMPMLNEFSNPSYCKSVIAYWGAGKNNSYYAMVYQLDKRTVLKNKFVGQSVLKTDYKYVLNPPQWAMDCSSVRFEDTNFKQKIKFKFPLQPPHKTR